jgi:hypothetical protein
MLEEEPFLEYPGLQKQDYINYQQFNAAESCRLKLPTQFAFTLPERERLRNTLPREGHVVDERHSEEIFRVAKTKVSKSLAHLKMLEVMFSVFKVALFTVLLCLLGREKQHFAARKL